MYFLLLIDKTKMCVSLEQVILSVGQTYFGFYIYKGQKCLIPNLFQFLKGIFHLRHIVLSIVMT